MKHPTITVIALLIIGLTLAANLATIAATTVAVTAIIVGGKCYRQRLRTPPPAGDFHLSISRRYRPVDHAPDHACPGHPTGAALRPAQVVTTRVVPPGHRTAIRGSFESEGQS